MTLNHIRITNAKPRDKAYKVADSDGLYLVVQTNGAKLWRMNYRHLGRQKTLYFGAWPEVGIAMARQQRDKAREQIAAGLDPAAEKRIETLARKVAADNTFKTIAEEWVAKNEREGRAPITLDKIRWLLGMAYPMIGTLPVSKISPQEVLAVLRKVEATGRYESARRMRSVLSRVFRYAIATARADRDVAADLRGALITPKVQHLAAITTPKEAGGLLRAIDGYALNPAGDLSISRTQQTFEVESFDLSPSLMLTEGRWQISLAGTYGKDVTNYRGDTFTGANLSSTAQGRYTNRSQSLELSANGELFSLPGGSVRLAAGAGLRVNDFNLFRGAGVISNIDAQQNSRFVYGEIGIPIVAPAMGVPFIDRLELNAAGRYENYRGIGGITTPKLGLIYAPSPDVDFKASWGRSFRAPTFIQQYQVRQAALYPAGVFSGTNFPAGSTALVLFGGNRNLGPEKASSWSATLALHPRGLEGLNLDVSYFSTRYVDRIVNPVPFLALALSSPLYADQVTLAPPAAAQSAIVASADQFFNFSGGVYDPSRVVAIINTASVNAGRQTIRGIDALMRYNARIGSIDTLTFALNLSYLESDQQLTLQQPSQPLSGQLFSPPNWRGRGSIAWKHGGLTAAATVGYIDGVSDPRTTPALEIRGMTTLDLSALYAFDASSGPLHGLEIGLSAQNAFNATPAVIATTQATDTPYDSTNYSPAGRVLSVRLTKKW